MGGIGFIHGGFLTLGAALAMVPLVVHLLFRKKAPRVDVGSLRFLKVAIRDNAHRRKIRRWLLLAARMAGVLLLGLLFARPYWLGPTVPGQDREVVLLIDRSASMGAGEPAKSPFTKARTLVSELIRSFPEGTEVHLALFDESGVDPVPTEKLDQVAKAPGSAGTGLAGAVAWARDRMVQSRRKAREVRIFTDLQQTGKPEPSTGDFPEGVTVEIVDVGRTFRSNLAIEDARAIRTDFRPEVPPLVSVRVFNAGSFPARDVKISLSLEGNGETIRLTEVVTVEGRSRREVRFSPTIRGPGVYRGLVELLERDEMAFDDRRWLAFESRGPEPILLVDGQPGPTVFDHETYFLEAVLRLRLSGAGLPVTPFEPRRIVIEPGSSWPDLASTKVVVLANVAEVPVEVASSLQRFVEGGGRLVIFSGSNLGKRALGSLQAIGLLPAEPEGIVDGPARLDTWESSHPWFRPFSDPQRGDLRSLLFFRVERLRPMSGSSVLASSRGGLPLVVESAVGPGRVLQLAIPADNDWGEWAIHRLYLPVVHQMMGYLTDRLPDSGKIAEAPADANAAPGIIPEGNRLIVRNVEASESSIDRATLEVVRKAYRLPEKVVDVDEPGRSTIPIPAESERRGETWQAIAWVLLVVLVAETFLANRTYG